MACQRCPPASLPLILASAHAERDAGVANTSRGVMQPVDHRMSDPLGNRHRHAIALRQTVPPPVQP